MKRETQTVFYCDNCDCMYDNAQDCYNCEQADRIIGALVGVSDEFNFLDGESWMKEEGIHKKGVLVDRMRSVFENLWGENGTHVHPVATKKAEPLE